MPEKEKKSKIDERQLVIFRVAKEEFGVEISQVKEIIKMEDITSIPNTEEHIKGVINLRGKIIVVVSLAKKLTLPIKQIDKDSRIVIIEVNDSVVGMIVDSVEEVLRINVESISVAPEMIRKEIDSDYLKGVCVIGQRLIILLDLASLITKKDVLQINKINEANKEN